MKFVNFQSGNGIRLGIKTDQGIIDIKKAAAAHSLEIPSTIEGVIAEGEGVLATLAQLTQKDVETISEEKIHYAPVVTKPEKIICVGLNYIDHAKESQMDIPTSPLLFSKFNNALAAHGQAISLPKDAEQFDYEAELVIVMGKEASKVSKEDALSYVFGYTVGNDFSARDLQFRTGQWLLGKSCDDFAPIGPYVVTRDGIDVQNLEVKCTVNGELRQSANTRDMIFDCATIISYVSQYMTLKPGDLIFSGTPEGVILGYPTERQQWLKPGDKVIVSIESIGELVNVVGK